MKPIQVIAVLTVNFFNKKERYCGHATNHTEWYDEPGSEFIENKCARFLKKLI